MLFILYAMVKRLCSKSYRQKTIASSPYNKKSSLNTLVAYFVNNLAYISVRDRAGNSGQITTILQYNYLIIIMMFFVFFFSKVRDLVITSVHPIFPASATQSVYPSIYYATNDIYCCVY